jgi:hypothetical protein
MRRIVFNTLVMHVCLSHLRIHPLQALRRCADEVDAYIAANTAQSEYQQRALAALRVDAATTAAHTAAAAGSHATNVGSLPSSASSSSLSSSSSSSSPSPLSSSSSPALLSEYIVELGQLEQRRLRAAAAAKRAAQQRASEHAAAVRSEQMRLRAEAIARTEAERVEKQRADEEAAAAQVRCHESDDHCKKHRPSAKMFLSRHSCSPKQLNIESRFKRSSKLFSISSRTFNCAALLFRLLC